MQQNLRSSDVARWSSLTTALLSGVRIQLFEPIKRWLSTCEQTSHTYTFAVPHAYTESCHISYVQIVMNRSLPWYTDGVSGVTSIPLVPEATCVFSACYSASSLGTVFVSPTGCLAAPVTPSTHSENGDADSRIVFTEGVMVTSPIPIVKPSSGTIGAVNRLTFGLTVGIAIFATAAITAVGLIIMIVISAMRAMERKRIGKKELQLIGVGLTECVDTSYTPVDVAMSNAHDGNYHATSQMSILDSLEKHSTMKVERDPGAVSMEAFHQTASCEIKAALKYDQSIYPDGSTHSLSGGYTAEE